MNELTDDDRKYLIARVTELKKIVKYQEEEAIPQLKREISILEKLIA